MSGSLSRRSFVALSSLVAASLVASPALADDAADAAAVPAPVPAPEVDDSAQDVDGALPDGGDPTTQAIEGSLPADPTYDDFVELAQEQPGLIPPDPGPLGGGLVECASL